MHSEDIAGRSQRCATAAGAGDPLARGFPSKLDRLLFSAMNSAMRAETVGRLQVILPSGLRGVVGGSPIRASATSGGVTIVIRTYKALWNMYRRGAVGFADSYIAGEIDTESLHGVFGYYLDNEVALTQAAPGLQRSNWRERLIHARRNNTRAGSRRNIAAHYDLGNEFYRLWLGPGMFYSSAIFLSPAMSLEAAQAQKVSRILGALEVEPGHTLLEIGCGWGGFAAAAAACGATVTGITISRQQFDEATALLVREGSGQRGSIRFEDYRDTKGQFDRLASIEMIEAVGEHNWPRYFRMIADRLRPGGVAVLQAITIRPDLLAIYRANPDFIQRYIFPGGMLPTVEAMGRHAQAAGLEFETVETFGRSYARTLAEWRIRFRHAWPEIAALGFDERFRRMWEYYLAYCEVGFQRGTIDVGLYRLRKSAITGPV